MSCVVEGDVGASSALLFCSGDEWMLVMICKFDYFFMTTSNFS